MTQHGDYLRRLRDAVHELQVLVDEAISENDRVEDAVTDAMHKVRVHARGCHQCPTCSEIFMTEEALFEHRWRTHDASLRHRRPLRSVADLRDDDEQARAEDYLLRGGA